ncbi:MAG TPA: hypothetical protein P5239_04715 [Victivallales bacterium]|nr:hypothetical protein [Victivallales bacterium]
MPAPFNLLNFSRQIMRKRREYQFCATTGEELIAAFRRKIEECSIDLFKIDSSAIDATVKLLASIPDEIQLWTLDAIHLYICSENKIFLLFTTGKMMLKAAKN